MSIDSSLPVPSFLPVAYGQRLPERFVLSPVNRMSGETPYSYPKITDGGKYHDGGKSLNYQQNRQAGSVKVITLKTFEQKGTIVDLMA